MTHPGAIDRHSRTEGRPRLAGLRRFLETEAGGAVVLLAATIVALLWANSAWGDGYDALWATPVSFQAGAYELGMSLGTWINDGLMTLFFLLIGLEVRREFDMGEFRDRRRVAAPVIAAIGGMLTPVLIFLLITGGDDARGWAMVMATDTAFAVGVLALVGRRSSFRLRSFLLTLVIVDDVVASATIGFVYSEDIVPVAAAVAVGLLVVMVGLRKVGVQRSGVYVVLGLAIWLATLESGIHPTIAGVAVGLLTSAYPPRRSMLERASGQARAFRERPTPELAREAARGISLSLSPNDRLQHALHPWTSFLVVPLFALANAGFRLSPELVTRALGSPLVLGVVLGLVVGKTLGIPFGAWIATRARLGGQVLPVTWPSLISASAVAGIGFTMSLLIAELSYGGALLDEAKLGILSASVIAATLGAGLFWAAGALPRDWLRRAEARTVPPLLDLSSPVDPERDHVRGPLGARVTLLEYGDYQCPHCAAAAPVIRDLLDRSEGRLRFVFRHLPLVDVHPGAALAAEAAEAAGEQGRFWEMHDRLLDHQEDLDAHDLVRHAAAIGLDLARFQADLDTGRFSARVGQDVNSAEEAGVAGTPTFFIDGVRYEGAYDTDPLEARIRKAGRLPVVADQVTAASA
jgi:Na+/H+ antiporter NhaA